MKKRMQHGNAALGAVIGTALIGLLYLQSVHQEMSSQMNISRNNRLRTEGNEAALYALSVATQLLSNNPATNTPYIAADNIVNPDVSTKLTLRALSPIPAGPIALDVNGNLKVMAPLGGQVDVTSLNQLFRNQNFVNLKNSLETAGGETDVTITASRHEPFDSGFGIRKIVLDAAVQTKDRNLAKDQNLRALVTLNVPDGNCELEVFVDGVKQANNSSIPAGKTGTANMKCTGAVLSAQMDVTDSATTKSISVGPPTSANSFNSNIPSLFPSPLAITSPGINNITATYWLLDGKPIHLSETLTILEPPKPLDDILKCLDKCPGCNPTKPADWSPCDPANPLFQPLKREPITFTWPTVSGPLDTYEAADERAAVRQWAIDNGQWDNLITFMSLAYPRYPNILVCQGTYDLGWEPYGFDPENNCEETPVADRGYIGCLDPDSLITLRPGIAVPIRLLRAGHTVYNPVTRTLAKIRKVTKGPEKKVMWHLTAGTHDLKLTDNHPVMTADGEKLASDLTPNDKILIAGAWESVAKIIGFQPGANQEVWNIELDASDERDAHWLEANGIVVGDLWMQEQINQ